jgi:hypothetical protein
MAKLKEGSPMIDITPGFKEWIEIKKRACSPEVDFGVWWTMTGNEREFPRWRLSWIENTGELYACQPAKDRFIKLGIIPDRDRLNSLLAGWSDPDSQIYHNLKALARRIENQE